MHKNQVITSKSSRFSDVKITFTNNTKRHFWVSRKNMRNQAKMIKNFAHNIYASYASQYVCRLKVFESFGGK